MAQDRLPLPLDDDLMTFANRGNPNNLATAILAQILRTLHKTVTPPATPAAPATPATSAKPAATPPASAAPATPAAPAEPAAVAVPPAA
jgi:hypothetical protein